MEGSALVPGAGRRWCSGRGTCGVALRRGDQGLERLAERAGPFLRAADVQHFEGQVEAPLDLGCGAFELRCALLREPNQSAVVAEVVREQLGVPVDPELTHHARGEAAHEVVGEQVGPGLLGVERSETLTAREELVAGSPRQSGEPLRLAAGVERAVGAAVGVRERNTTALAPEARDGRAGSSRDLGGPVVQRGGEGDDLDGEPTPARLAPERADQRPARDDGDRRGVMGREGAGPARSGTRALALGGAGARRSEVGARYDVWAGAEGRWPPAPARDGESSLRPGRGAGRRSGR